MSQIPSVTGEEQLQAGRFIALKTLHWIDAYGAPRKWESAERVANAGAVLIIARLAPSGRILLVRQYRPPARREVIEFPAGLMDAGETPEATAARELREETGYVAKTLRVHPAAYTTPGLSNESVFMVMAEIDEDAPENIEPETDFDGSEMIESLFVPERELGEFYRRETANGVAFDAKLAAYILARDPGE